MPAYCVAANSPLNSVLKLKSLPKKKKKEPIVAFLNPKTPNYLKNRSQRFHLLASAFSPTWRNPNLLLLITFIERYSPLSSRLTALACDST